MKNFLENIFCKSIDFCPELCYNNNVNKEREDLQNGI